MAEDQPGALGQGLIPLEAIPDREGRGVVVFIVVGLIPAQGRGVNQQIVPFADPQLRLERPGPEKDRDRPPLRLRQSQEGLQRHLAAVSEPLPAVSLAGLVQIVEHHQLVIAQQHPAVGAGHQPPENGDAVGQAVHHVPEDVEGILRAQADLLQNGAKSGQIAVDIGDHVGHRHPSLRLVLNEILP